MCVSGRRLRLVVLKNVTDGLLRLFPVFIYIYILLCGCVYPRVYNNNFIFSVMAVCIYVIFVSVALWGIVCLDTGMVENTILPVLARPARF